VNNVFSQMVIPFIASFQAAGFQGAVSQPAGLG